MMALRKIFVSTASSAAGTGAVLGVAGAMTPEAPKFDHAFQPVERKTSGLVNIDLEGSSSLVVISVIAIIAAVLVGVCCRKAPRCRSTKKKQKKIQELVIRSLEMMEEGKGRVMEQRDRRVEMEKSMEMEGEVKPSRNPAPGSESY